MKSKLRSKNNKAAGQTSSKPYTQENLVALFETLKAFIRAESWEQSKRILKAHPELLSDRADDLMVELIHKQTNEQAVQILGDHRLLLRRCRKEGVDAAFKDRLREEDIALNNLAPQIVKRLQAITSEADLKALLDEHPELLPVVKGIVQQTIGQEEAQLLNAIQTFIGTDSWDTARQVVAANPVLLTPDADFLLAQFIEAQDDKRAVEILEQRRRTLAYYRLTWVHTM